MECRETYRWLLLLLFAGALGFGHEVREDALVLGAAAVDAGACL
jgi:hypothetical protein